MDNPIFTRCLSQAGRERTQYIHNIALSLQYPWVCMAVSFKNTEIFTEQKGFLKLSGTPNIRNLAFIISEKYIEIHLPYGFCERQR